MADKQAVTELLNRAGVAYDIGRRRLPEAPCSWTDPDAEFHP